MEIELGNESVIVGGFRIAVHARDEITLLDRIVDKTIGRLKFRYGDLGVEWAGEQKRHDEEKPGCLVAYAACQKGYHRGGSVHEMDGY